MSTLSTIILALAVSTASITARPALSARENDGLPAVVPANPRAGDTDLAVKLMTAQTATQRSHLLDQPGDHIFDFNLASNPFKDAVTTGKGGHTVAATSDTFHALIGNDVAMTVGFLGPCSINSPHVHNRATEFNIVVQGRLVTNAIEENGALSFEDVLSQYQATVFPKGTIHTEFNPDCTDAVFVAGFNDVDPGVSSIAQNFFGLRSDIVQGTLNVPTFNGQDLESFRHTIPDNVVLGIEKCLQTCNIPKRAKRSMDELLADN